MTSFNDSKDKQETPEDGMAGLQSKFQNLNTKSQAKSFNREVGIFKYLQWYHISFVEPC